MKFYTFLISEYLPNGYDPACLYDEIQANALISPMTTGYREVDNGTNIQIHFTKILSNAEIDVLSNILKDHSLTAPIESDFVLPIGILETGTGNLITIPDETTVMVGTDLSQVLTNKTIDASKNTILNLTDLSIANNAEINATKIHDGSVSNTEFGYLDGLNDNVQTQLNAKVDESINIIAGNALSGGGSLNSDVTINLDIPNLTEDLSPNGYIVFYDNASTEYKKALIDNLPSSGGGSGNGDPIVIDVYDNTGNQTTTSATGTTLNIDTIRKNTGQFSLSNDVITINESGTYSIHYRISTRILSGGNRSISSGWLQIDTGSGFATVDGSMVYMYNRTSTMSENTGSATVILDLFSGNSLRLQFNRVAGTDSIQTIQDSSGITISKINSSVVGPQGPAGSGSTINVELNNSVISGSPFEVLNFIGAESVVQNGADPTQVDITLSNSNNQSIFGSEFQEVSDESNDSTTSSTYQQKIRMTTSLLPTGKYRVGWFWEWNVSNSSADAEFRVQLNDTTDITNTVIESQDSVNYHPHSGFYYLDNVSGVQNIDIDYRINSGNGTITIRKARLEIWRIS